MFEAFGASSSVWKRTQSRHLESICSLFNLLNLDKPAVPRFSLPLAKVGLSKTDKGNENNNPAIYNCPEILPTFNPKGPYNLKRILRFVV